ncbi:MAG: winged helix-turn-helix domain-containing protein [Prevotella sp.]|nr:winged helix-turn-helix domain-containing protein [Prevotella sp.]
MLTNDVRINWGIMWQLLLDKRILSIRMLREFTGFRENMIYLALGWLSKEKKIWFSKEKICLSSNY